MTKEKEKSQSPVLFNLALEKFLHTRKNISQFSQNTLLAYTDDIVITDSSQSEVEIRILNIIGAAKLLNLNINQEEIKYLVISREVRDGMI